MRSNIGIAVMVLVAGSVPLNAQQPPLLDQTDVPVIIDFCMSPTGEKLMQPPESTIDRATFCGGISLGPGLVLAGMVRNVQMLDSTMSAVNTHDARLLALEQAIVSLEAQITALQTPVDYQPQIDAINATLASVKAAIP